MCIVEERAKELALREKEIDAGYKDLEVKKLEVAKKREKADGTVSVSISFFLMDLLLLLHCIDSFLLLFMLLTWVMFRYEPLLSINHF